jgi:hypothetical protein
MVCRRMIAEIREEKVIGKALLGKSRAELPRVNSWVAFGIVILCLAFARAAPDDFDPLVDLDTGQPIANRFVGLRPFSHRSMRPPISPFMQSCPSVKAFEQEHIRQDGSYRNTPHSAIVRCPRICSPSSSRKPLWRRAPSRPWELS